MTTLFDPLLSAQNAIFIEELYNKYIKNPESVDEAWRQYFAQIGENNKDFAEYFSGPSWVKRQDKIVDYKEKGEGSLEAKKGVPKASPAASDSHLSMKVAKLIDAFRAYGHTAVKLDPLQMQEVPLPKELDYKTYGILDEELDQIVYVGGVYGHDAIKLREIYSNLFSTYSGRFGVEFIQIDNYEEREWLRAKIESDVGVVVFDKEKKKKILSSLIEVEMFEEYLHTKFPGAKRFSIEGAESNVIAIEEVVEKSAHNNVQEMVFGMAHRGRLSVLAKIMKKPYRAMFSEFKGGTFIPDDLNLPGDVKYHLSASVDVDINGKSVHLTLTPNPSHLELVNSVVSGRVRAKQDGIADNDREKVMGVLLHGDAAFSGQGSVMESLVLSNVKGYTVGGTIHIITNNQIGFTTTSDNGRSSRYASDIAKMIAAPIFHVNGDDPESVAYVSNIAAEYRMKFKKDVFIDIVCYRKYGHNEGDEPMFTQPKMYNIIREHQTPSTIYAKQLLNSLDITQEEINEIKQKFKEFLNAEFELSDSYKAQKADWLQGIWKGFDEFLTDKNKDVITGVDKKELKNLTGPLSAVPKDFQVNAKIDRVLKSRREMLEKEEGIDWGMGETLAYATLLRDGYNIRISGEDVERGTFSHRHAVVVDQQSEAKYTPLQNLGEGQKANFEIHNSVLSELGVMGFEYGYSYSSPNTLVIWEAQYGDFANSAQMMIDQYISSGKDKWLRMNGLVLLLPHGYAGDGPEHSSARLERCLQLCANDNMTVANCTTPASIFHLLRRQMLRNYRSPLIIMTPKSLLRHKLAVSKLDDFAKNSSFKAVIEDNLTVDGITKVIFCTGKVYCDLFEEREKRARNDIALVRLEQLYPYPEDEMLMQLKKYKGAKQIIWCQEEHKNMGAWSYIKLKFDDMYTSPFKNSSSKISATSGPHVQTYTSDPRHLISELNFRNPSCTENEFSKRYIEYVGRDESASPAAGYGKLHQKELNAFLNKVFE